MSDMQNKTEAKAPSWNSAFVKDIGKKIGIDWKAVEFSPAQLLAGMQVELEHCQDPETDITKCDPYLTAKIAWAHLKESANYYTILAKAEAGIKEAFNRQALLSVDFEETEPKIKLEQKYHKEPVKELSEEEQKQETLRRHQEKIERVKTLRPAPKKTEKEKKEVGPGLSRDEILTRLKVLKEKDDKTNAEQAQKKKEQPAKDLEIEKEVQQEKKEYAQELEQGPQINLSYIEELIENPAEQTWYDYDAFGTGPSKAAVVTRLVPPGPNYDYYVANILGVTYDEDLEDQLVDKMLDLSEDLEYRLRENGIVGWNLEIIDTTRNDEIKGLPEGLILIAYIKNEYWAQAVKSPSEEAKEPEIKGITPEVKEPAKEFSKEDVKKYTDWPAALVDQPWFDYNKHNIPSQAVVLKVLIPFDEDYPENVSEYLEIDLDDYKAFVVYNKDSNKLENSIETLEKTLEGISKKDRKQQQEIQNKIDDAKEKLAGISAVIKGMTQKSYGFSKKMHATKAIDWEARIIDSTQDESLPEVPKGLILLGIIANADIARMIEENKAGAGAASSKQAIIDNATAAGMAARKKSTKKDPEARLQALEKAKNTLGFSSTRDEELWNKHFGLGFGRRQFGQASVKTAIVKECKEADLDDRPAAQQKICLYSHEGKLLGRHPDRDAAIKQEQAIKAREGKVNSAEITYAKPIDEIHIEFRGTVNSRGYSGIADLSESTSITGLKPHEPYHEDVVARDTKALSLAIEQWRNRQSKTVALSGGFMKPTKLVEKDAGAEVKIEALDAFETLIKLVKQIHGSEVYVQRLTDLSNMVAAHDKLAYGVWSGMKKQLDNYVIDIGKEGDDMVKAFGDKLKAGIAEVNAKVEADKAENAAKTAAARAAALTEVKGGKPPEIEKLIALLQRIADSEEYVNLLESVSDKLLAKDEMAKPTWKGIKKELDQYTAEIGQEGDEAVTKFSKQLLEAVKAVDNLFVTTAMHKRSNYGQPPTNDLMKALGPNSKTTGTSPTFTGNDPYSQAVSELEIAEAIGAPEATLERLRAKVEQLKSKQASRIASVKTTLVRHISAVMDRIEQTVVAAKSPEALAKILVALRQVR